MKNLEAVSVADALVLGLICRFRVPADITTDRGTQFPHRSGQDCATDLASIITPQQLIIQPDVAGRAHHQIVFFAIAHCGK